MIFDIQGIEDIPICAANMLKQCQDSRIFIFEGNLGAGKTTLIQELCRQLGYTGDVTSPTFSLINTYWGSDADVYHMDLYRLKSVEEAQDIGIEEFLASGQYCFIEWPDMIVNLIDEPYYHIQISIEENQARKIVCQKINIKIT
ncbi:MAG: tRNA (adenosine(37)-N6)-threonylcarbamoyltransferase complex ATPase subunit type 1 TsaE [Chitinophagales bacterium]|nr:tRNA (adenosine(37)-N6)-threonylcarbamoyltransferase complex ATPase subunit type 1 TsaE [Chitinophagales bacterium]